MSVAPKRRNCNPRGYEALDWGRGFNRGPKGDVDTWFADLARKVAAGLLIRHLPDTMPLALADVAKPEVLQSPALSLMARPGDGSIATRLVAIMVADGVSMRSVEPARTRLLAEDGQAIEFLKEQYRHNKPMLVLGAATMLLAKAGIMPPGSDRVSEIPGVIVASAARGIDGGYFRASDRQASLSGTGNRSAPSVTQFGDASKCGSCVRFRTDSEHLSAYSSFGLRKLEILT